MESEYILRLRAELQFFQKKIRPDGTPYFPYVIADRERRLKKAIEELTPKPPGAAP